MSERISRRRTSKPHRPSPSPAPSHNRRKTPDPGRNRRSSSSSRHVAEVMHRSSSEPCLWSARSSSVLIADDVPDTDQVLYRPQTCTDVFSSPDWPKSPHNSFQSQYKMDDKVVMNVTVEGSPGPVRVLLKLGWTVEDAIKLVVNKYVEEGRTPVLNQHDVVSSTFDLHHSCFSLQCLDRSVIIGDVGSRSFYLRKRKTLESSIGHPPQSHSIATPPPPFSLFFEFSGFIARKISLLIARTRKMCMFLGCIPFEEE